MLVTSIFLIFPKYFLYFSQQLSAFGVHLMSFANALNEDQSKSMLLGKELNDIKDKKQIMAWQKTF